MRDIRLYLEADFPVPSASIPLSTKQLHYLVSVMRVADQDHIRVFNGREGEWRGQLILQSKKQGHIILVEQNRPQFVLPERHLHFAPLKQSPLSFLIEKATELGVTHVHPMLTERTIVRSFRQDKQRLTAIEAAEQSERLSVPVFHDLCSLGDSLKSIKTDHIIYIGDERREAPLLKKQAPHDKPVHIFIGPEGGFTEKEFRQFQAHPQVQLVKLSDHILRAETAALCALSQV